MAFAVSYAFTWLAVLMLYAFNWSALCEPMNIGLLLFILGSIAVCVIYILFKYNPWSEKKKNKQRPGLRLEEEHKKRLLGEISPLMSRVLLVAAIGIIVITVADFFYMGGPPLFSKYTGFSRASEQVRVGIPGLHVISYCGLIVISVFLLYKAIFTNNKQAIVLVAVCIALLLLENSRSSLFCVVGAGAYFAFVKFYERVDVAPRHMKHKNTKNMFMYGIGCKEVIVIACIAILIGLCAAFAFGAYGNLRSGYEWNNSSYIMQLGGMDNYPKWLPQEFSWIYIYLVTPLGNLNHNIIVDNLHPDALGLLFSNMPISIAKYFIPTVSRTVILNDALNACTGYVYSYYYAGFFGLVFTFLVWGLILWGSEMLLKYKLNNSYKEVIVYFIIYCTFSTCFYNPLYNLPTCTFIPAALLFALIAHVTANTKKKNQTANDIV